MNTNPLRGLLLTALLFGLAGCFPAANDDELSQMCENLIRVRAEIRVPVESELIAEIEADYTRRKEHLVNWKAREMKSWDDELDARIKALPPAGKAPKKAAATTDGEEAPPTRASLEAEYAKKKQIGAEQFDSDIEALAPAKDLAMKAAREKVESKTAEFAAAKKDCLDKARSTKVTRAQAQCRIKARDPDTYWNKCR